MHSENDHEKILNELILSLKTPHLNRTPKQVNSLIAYMSSLHFFKSTIIPIGHEIVFRTCEFMDYEFFPKDSFICHSGDPGDKFFVILKGCVRVLLSSSQDSSETEVAKLTEGHSFGEYALLHNQPRLATIQCCESTHLAVLNKENYLGILGRIETKRLDDLATFLRSFAIFQKWSRGPLIKISYFLKERVLNRNSIIFREGEPTNEIVFIKAGEVELLKSMKNEKESKLTYFHGHSATQRANVAILGAGETVGEELLQSDKHTYTCRVYSFVATVLIMSKQDFRLRVRNEDSHNALIALNEEKEGTRNHRVQIFHTFKEQTGHIKDDSEDRTLEVELRKIERINRLVNPHRRHTQLDPHISEDLRHGNKSRTRPHSPVSVEGMSSKNSNEIRLAPMHTNSLKRKTEPMHAYPIDIEQKPLIERRRTMKPRTQSTDFINIRY